MGYKQRKLTKKQKFFVAEYQKDWNATQAAIRAGFSPESANEIAYQLLHKTLHVKEALQKDINERLRKIGVHSEKVLTEIVRVGLSDIRRLFQGDGSLKPPKEWDDETAAAISGLEIFEEFTGKGKNRKLTGHTKKVKTYDKVKALELLSKHLGIVGDWKRKDEGEEEEISRTLSTLELSAKIVYLVKLAAERKQIERKSAPVEDTKDG